MKYIKYIYCFGIIIKSFIKIIYWYGCEVEVFWIVEVFKLVLVVLFESC